MNAIVIIIIIFIILSSIVPIILLLTYRKKESFLNPSMQDLKKQIDDYVPLDDGKDKWGNPVALVDEVCMKICCQLALRAASNGNFGIGVVIYDSKGDLRDMLNGAFLMDDPQVGKGKVMYDDFLKQMLNALDASYSDPNHPHRTILDRIVGVGQNQLFTQGLLTDPVPHVRSDRHGEMVAMDLLEDAIASLPDQESKFQVTFPKGVILFTQLESCGMCMSRLVSSSIEQVRNGAADYGGGFVHKACGYPPVFIGLMDMQIWTTALVSGNKDDPQNPEHLIGLCNQTFGINIADVGTKQNKRGCTADGCPNYKYCYPDRNPDIVNRTKFDVAGFMR